MSIGGAQAGSWSGRWLCGRAKPGLIHHCCGHSIYSRAGVRRGEPEQVIVGREDAFFTADEEKRGRVGVVLMPQ